MHNFIDQLHLGTAANFRKILGLGKGWEERGKKKEIAAVGANSKW